MHESFKSFVNSLRCADTFEQAAQGVLHGVANLAEACLRNSAYGETGRLLRCMVHLRPGGYRGLVILDCRDGKLLPPDADAVVAPSATVWHLVEKHACPVTLDVQLGQCQYLTEGVQGESVPAPRQPFDATESVQRLLERDATHLLALPLWGPGGSLNGMISLEAGCHQAMGREFIWQTCVQDLQLLADFATPILSALPLAAMPVVRDDPGLPVVGQSMAGLVNLLDAFARQEETILLTGPTGAGKSRLAAWCHGRSGRAGPFQVVDLLTVPEDMQMGELFGWKKGAFTGAGDSRAGCVARARNGTLFIDEIDKLSLKAQAGLLHLLETRQYRVLGDPGSQHRAEVRFIIGTNADLKAQVQEGCFREDLYYRIYVLPIRVPGLDERRDEIGAWAVYMLSRQHGNVQGQGQAVLDAEASLRLTHCPWPGNLRQLDNVVRRAYAIALAEQGTAAPGLHVRLKHVEQALSFEMEGSSPSLMAVLRRAAEAFVDLALEDDSDRNKRLLDDSAALKGLILEAALGRLGDLKQVYGLFGQQKLVESRNHTRDYRREQLKVQRLIEVLGGASSDKPLATKD